MHHELVLRPNIHTTKASPSISNEVSMVLTASATVHTAVPYRARICRHVLSTGARRLTMGWTMHGQEFSIGEKLAVQGGFSRKLSSKQQQNIRTAQPSPIFHPSLTVMNCDKQPQLALQVCADGRCTLYSAAAIFKRAIVCSRFVLSIEQEKRLAKPLKRSSKTISSPHGKIETLVCNGH